jgi:Uma2 family endonuclease
MNWQEVLNDKSLHDSAYKIELNSDGFIVSSQRTNWHALWKAEISTWLRELLHNRGYGFVSASVDTPEGVKVPDVAWASRAFIERYGLGTPFPKAPEICVEIISPSNTNEEIKAKSNLYFEQGAQEVWLCNLEGTMRFLNANESLERSKLVPECPVQLEF